MTSCKSLFCHREHRENEFFSKVSVGSVARQWALMQEVQRRNILTKFQRLALAILVLFICTGFDQVTKDIAQEKFASSPTISLLNDTIRIQYSENPGAMLGLGSRLPDNVRFMLFVLFNGLISG